MYFLYLFRTLPGSMTSCLDKACIKETRHEIGVVVTVDVTVRNLIEVCECPLHGGVKTGSFPENIKATVQRF